MNEKGLKILARKNLLLGLKSYNLDLCEHCIYGRKQRVSFIRSGHEQKMYFLELIHSDVFGPININSLGGTSYFVTFIDDASRKVWSYLMKSVQQHKYSNRGRTPSVITHTTISNINKPMFSRGKTPTGKHPWPQPMWPLGAIY
jgi:hypothetical protein